MKRFATIIVAIFAVFIIHMVDGNQVVGDKLSFKNNGVFVYEQNEDKASTETDQLVGYVPNYMIRSIERVE